MTEQMEEARALLTYSEMGSGGRCDWKQLREAVSEARMGWRDFPDDVPSEIYPGHVMVAGINYNSLDRIVTAFVDEAITAALNQRDEARRDIEVYRQIERDLNEKCSKDFHRALAAEAEVARLREALARLVSEKAPSYHDCIDAADPQCAWCDADEALALNPKGPTDGQGDAS